MSSEKSGKVYFLGGIGRGSITVFSTVLHGLLSRDERQGRLLGLLLGFADGAESESCRVVARGLAQLLHVLGDHLMFVIREIIANVFGLGGCVKSLNLKLWLENLADKVTNGFLVMQAGQLLEFFVLFRRQLNFQGHFLPAFAFGFAGFFYQQVREKLADADVLLAAVLGNLLVFVLRQIRIEKALTGTLGLSSFLCRHPAILRGQTILENFKKTRKSFFAI
jgi:hypothetical protein